MAHMSTRMKKAKSSPQSRTRSKIKDNEIARKDDKQLQPQNVKEIEVSKKDKSIENNSAQKVGKKGRKPKAKVTLRSLNLSAVNRGRKPNACEPINTKFAILAEELLREDPIPVSAPIKSHIECIQREPEIITMKAILDNNSVLEPTCSKSAPPAYDPWNPNSPTYILPDSEPLQTITDYQTVEQDGKTWTIPEPVNPPLFSFHKIEKYVLPVSDEDHKVKKIEDMTILREMLKLTKVQLSNGVHISVPVSRQPSECDHCGKIFRFKTDLRKHMYIHLDIRPFNCPQCEKSFRQQGNLKTHITRMHTDFLTSPTIFQCHHCDKQFVVKEAIRAHVLTHVPVKPYVCKHCGKRFAKDVVLRQHLRGHAGPCLFYCFICNASYDNRARLNMHIKTHLGIKNNRCPVCDKAFARLECIQKHMSCYHENVKRFQCPICSKKLKGHLTEHLRTHAHSKPYACLDCGRRFAQQSQLVVHKRCHTGIKPYQCRICEKMFTHSNALKLHVRRHTGEKPFHCAMCPFSFSQLPHMKAHMLNIHNKHEAYKCENCGEFFKLRSAMDVHQQNCLDPEDLNWKRLKSRNGGNSESAMSISQMRFLLAILFKKIADDDRLKVLGFNKRLVDDLLIDSLEATGHTPCKDLTVPPIQRLKKNIKLLLNWTVPPDAMKRYRKEKKSTEDVLKELTN